MNYLPGTSRLPKLFSERQTDIHTDRHINRQTDRTKIIYHPASRVVNETKTWISFLVRHPAIKAKWGFSYNPGGWHGALKLVKVTHTDEFPGDLKFLDFLIPMETHLE